MKPTLEDYLREFEGTAIDFDVRVLSISDEGVEFIIHPHDLDGRTANFFVEGASVRLASITNPTQSDNESSSEFPV